MNIHYLSSSTIASDAANAVHVMKMCQAFAAHGHDVTLHAWSGGLAARAAFAAYGVAPAFALVRYDPGLARAPRWLRATRVPLVNVPFMRAFGRRHVRSALIAARPDLVYARNASMLLFAGAPYPFVYEAHRPPDSTKVASLERAVVRHPNFRRLVVISERLKRVYTARFGWLRDEDVIVAHDGADDPGVPVGEPSRVARGFGVGFVGHLYRGRGTDLIRSVAARLPHVAFHVVGGTQEDVDSFVASGLTPNVTVHGHVPHGDLGRKFELFDVGIAPYQTHVAIAGRPGTNTAAVMSPLKIFEYMSWGKAIVCSDLPVLHEVLEHGHTAVFAPPTDVDAWVAAIEGLASSPRRVAQLGAAARDTFLKRYTWSMRAERVLEGLREGVVPEPSTR